MTFETFQEFTNWCMDNENLNVHETNFTEGETNWVCISELDNTGGIHVAEMLISAYDSQFFVGWFHAEKHNGEVIIQEN